MIIAVRTATLLRAPGAGEGGRGDKGRRGGVPAAAIHVSRRMINRNKCFRLKFC